MPAFTATAPAKAILVGEHAVVYGYPAIAFPINQLTAKTTILANPLGKPDEIRFRADDIQLNASFDELPADHPFIRAIQAVKTCTGVNHLPACTVMIRSKIPLASGLGSSAATSVSVIRALCQLIGFHASLEQISLMAFQVEEAYHGTPSGIDNTVITYAKPIKFSKKEGFQILSPKKPLTFIVANSGTAGNTKEAVSKVRSLFELDPNQYGETFTEIASVVNQAEKAIEEGDQELLGQMMNLNQELLRKLTVSHPSLEKLIETALIHGALGAKLSGGGLGGNMVALVSSEFINFITEKLKSAGATDVIFATIQANQNG